jgi:predicted AlkP superfamily phosphohydrolase/phosphomutase
MPFLKKKPRDRVVVIGLDGVPRGLLQELAEAGVMPRTAELIKAMHLHRMKASLPEISAVSWTDFMTGVNSGSHGVFGFTDFKTNSYGIRFPNFQDVRVPTLWDRLGERQKRCIILNQPSTYPARKVNGALVSGFVAIDFEKAVWPASHIAPLKKMGYQVDIDTLKSRQDAEFFWKDLQRTLDGRKRALDYFWAQDWDYFELVITGTDRLHHYHWSAGRDPKHAFHGRFMDFYRQVDGLIGKVAAGLDRLGRSDWLFMLSDHGFTDIEQEVYLNAWLQKEGYLNFKTDAPQGLEDIAPGARAFALDPNRIFINMEGRFPAGAVKAADRQSLKDEIAAKLARLEHGGRKVVRRVFDARDVYTGPLAGQGPDLLVLSEYGYDMKGSVKKKDVFSRSDLQGMHTWDDAFFLAADDHGPDLAISGLAEILMKKFA